jgi:predicted glycoside hydrolase/deacetylase ChbG (UPF0249 family)
LLGRDPTHIDSHQHVHRRQPLAAIVLALGDDLGVPVRSVSSDVRFAGGFYGQTSKGEPLPDAVGVDALIRTIRSLPHGTTELSCHPGEVFDLDSTYRDERLREVETLCDPRIRETIEVEGIELCSFSDL